MSAATAIKLTDPAMVGAPRYARETDELYETPAWCTRALLASVRLPPFVWECASGNEAIARELRAAGHCVRCSDKEDGGFLNSCSPPPGVNGPAIVTNPPYDQAVAFVRHALDVAPVVAMLLRNEWDSAAGRRDLFLRADFAAKIVLTRRPIWFPDREQRASPRHNFSWFAWSESEVRRRGRAQLIYPDLASIGAPHD